MAGYLGIEFHAKEPAAWEYRAHRVLAELQRRAIEDTSDRPHRCLVILDNVDDAVLLGFNETRLLPRAPWLQIIVTSQLGPAEAPDIERDAWLPLDRLSDEDAFRVLERLQPTGSFPDSSAEQVARNIGSSLDGFTMAVECAGIFLARFQDEGQSLNPLEGLTGFEAVSDRVQGNLFLHDQKRLTATLAPILERLQPDEWLTLQFAAVMPADSVIWEWIECLVGDRFPEVEMAGRLSRKGCRACAL